MTFESPSGGPACGDPSQCPLTLRELLGTQAPVGPVSDGQVSEGLKDKKLTDAQTAELGVVGLEGSEAEPKVILDPFALGKAVRDYINDFVKICESYDGSDSSNDNVIIAKANELKSFLEANMNTNIINPPCFEETLWFVDELLATSDVLKRHAGRLRDIIYGLNRLLSVIRDDIVDELQPNKDEEQAETTLANAEDLVDMLNALNKTRLRISIMRTDFKVGNPILYGDYGLKSFAAMLKIGLERLRDKFKLGDKISDEFIFTLGGIADYDDTTEDTIIIDALDGIILETNLVIGKVRSLLRQPK